MLSKWITPVNPDTTDLNLQQALDLLNQANEALKRIDECGLIDRKVFPGYEHMKQTRENFLNHFKPDKDEPLF